MRLDHLVYAAAPEHLADEVQRLGSALGGGFVDGGLHPRFGTRNFVLPLANDSYLEVVAALDHPASDAAPFGKAVKARAAEGGGWLGWAVGVDDIALIEARLGRSAVPGHRRRPDGVDLEWKQIGVNELIADPQVPFFVQWLVAPELHPAFNAASDLRIERLEISGDEERVTEYLGAPRDHPLEGVEVDWVDSEERGLIAVHISTPRGVVRLD
jgi:hypothetical protein